MNILIIGYGSIGRRYEAILRYLGHQPIIYDPNVIAFAKTPLDICDRVIIASPTDTHLSYVGKLKQSHILVEKPIAIPGDRADRRVQHLQTYGKDLRIICNYRYLRGGLDFIGGYEIAYDYYATGPHLPIIDCIQLFYLANSLTIRTQSPIFSLTINGEKISLEEIHMSYVRMIEDWLTDNSLWDINDIKRQHLKLSNHMKEKNLYGS